MKYEDEKLLSMSVSELRILKINAEKYVQEPSSKFYSAGVSLLKQLDALGIVIPEKEITLDSPEGKKLQSVIFSEEGRVAALKAAKEGIAPMELIDPMLQQAMGPTYQGGNGATVQAGYVVANLMRQLHWEVNPRRRADLPANCIAKTAALYVHIPSKRSND